MSTNENTGEDYVIWQRLKAGEPQAIDWLMRKYYSDLHNYGLKLSLNRSLTKDCIQDLFVRLWQDRAKLSDVTFVKTYLLKTLKRDLIRKMVNAQRHIGYNEQFETQVEIVFSVEDMLINQQVLHQQKEALVESLNSLPKRQKEAIYLKFYENLSSEQIADVMALQPQSVYNLIHEALKQLKDRLVKSYAMVLLLAIIFG
jgi:RNA polymerase sigma factor (sigma-70 family)